MVADRLEIYPPGAVPNTLMVESLLYSQSAQNETLTSLLAQCLVPTDSDWVNTDRRTFMDKRGKGFASSWKTASGYRAKAPNIVYLMMPS